MRSARRTAVAGVAALLAAGCPGPMLALSGGWLLRMRHDPFHARTERRLLDWLGRHGAPSR